MSKMKINKVMERVSRYLVNKRNTMKDRATEQQ